MEEEDKQKNESWSALKLAWQLGYTIAIPLVIFALAGRYLDKKLGTTPFLLLLGMILAITLTSWLIWKKTKEILN